MGGTGTHGVCTSGGQKVRPASARLPTRASGSVHACDRGGRGCQLRHRLLVAAVVVAVLGIGFWPDNHAAQPTTLSLRIGQPFEEVVKNSTYPVMKKSNLPVDHDGTGAIWVTEPAVSIRFNDPEHGFTLPPTKFASLFFQSNVAQTLATTPMLDKLPFDQVVTLLENLQNQFKAAGWEPWQADGSEWFDLSPGGRKQLYEAMFDPGSKTASLRVPKKYSMAFRLWCASGCRTREPPYLFLIDIGIGHDFYAADPPAARKDSTCPVPDPALSTNYKLRQLGLRPICSAKSLWATAR